MGRHSTTTEKVLNDHFARVRLHASHSSRSNSMSHFPVTHSNLSATHLGLFLQDKYPFSGEVTCRLVRSGLNDSYLVQAGDEKFIFRVYSLNWREKHEILEEIRLLMLLHENGIVVSYPIRDNTHEYIYTFEAPEGERLGVLFSFAEGEKLQNYSGEAHHNVGVLMARFHQITEGLTLQRTTYNADTLITTPLDQLSQFLPSTTEEWQYMKSLQDFLLRELQSVNTAELRQGAVHLDIWFDNLNITKDLAITLFDFDFCGNGWLCLDIAYYMMQLFNVEREDAVCRSKLDSFIAGYESITIISDEEKRLLPQLGLALNLFYLGNMCRRFENWSNVFLSEMYLKRFVIGIVKRYADIHGLPDSIR